MIVQIRVDDRLIHGQVALVWTKELAVQGIVVANDEAAASSVMQTTLKMAAPDGIKLLIRSVDEAARLLDDPRSEKMRILVLVSRVRDALAVARVISVEGGVNIANAGRFDKASDGERVRLTSNALLSADELKALKELLETGADVFAQQLPTSQRIDVAKQLKEITA